MRRIFAVVVLCGFAAALSACGGPKQQAKPQDKQLSRQQTADIRARADAAFEDLDAVERGVPPPKREEPTPPPKKEPPPEPPKPYKEKPIVVPVNPARARPDWVGSQPNMEGYYVGVGVSTSHGNEEEDWARARTNAYVELASTLKVSIKSMIKDYFQEKNLRLYDKDNITKDQSSQNSDYAQDASFFVDTTLEGVEIVDRWKDEGQKKFWMLVRLSKAEIERKIRERLENARKKAEDYVKAAVAAEGQGRIGEAFKGYFFSYLALREYFGGIVEYDINGDGKKEILNHEIERAVTRLATSLDWKAEDPNRKAVISQALAQPLRVQVVQGGAPVKNLPVAFAFQRGTGSVEPHTTTGEDGVASAKVVKIFGQKQAIIGARVDVGALVENERDRRIVEAKFGNDIDVKTGKFFVELEELTAFIDIREENLGEEVRPGSVAADMKDLLAKELGMTFAASAKGADMEITGEAVTGECSDMYSQRVCVARVNITVADRLHNRQLFAKKYKISGNAENDKSAGLEALRKVGPRIAREIIKAMQ